MNPQPKNRPLTFNSLEQIGKRFEMLESRIDSMDADRKAHNDLLVRIDERTRRISEDITFLKGEFVKKDEFIPIQKLVYGMVGLILISVVGSLLALIIQQ